MAVLLAQLQAGRQAGYLDALSPQLLYALFCMVGEHGWQLRSGSGVAGHAPS